MAKNYFGVVLTTKEHDKYRLVVYRYKDPGILNTCPMCQLLRAIHKFQQEYTEIHREHCSRIPPRKWYELGRLTPPTIEIVGFPGLRLVNLTAGYCSKVQIIQQTSQSPKSAIVRKFMGDCFLV